MDLLKKKEEKKSKSILTSSQVGLSELKTTNLVCFYLPKILLPFKYFSSKKRITYGINFLAPFSKKNKLNGTFKITFSKLCQKNIENFFL